MDQSEFRLLDLPNEILLIVLKKLNNIDVLYSLLNVGNERLNLLAQDKIFSSTLNFVSIDHFSSVNQQKLDQFCLDILPRIHQNIQFFILESVSMERILLAADYPNLTRLKLFNFEEKIALHCFTNQSPLRYIFQQQITDLVLANNDQVELTQYASNYTRNVYGHILKFFRNLKHLTIIEKFNPSYPPVGLAHLPSTTFFSSTLTYLCINVYTLDDCLSLLDGRLKQLTTFIVQIFIINETSSISHNMDNLPNLKCFSMTCYVQIDKYDERILPLLRRMSHLEKLTLYLRIKNRKRLIDRTHLQNEIFVSMPQLHSFTFYVCTYIHTIDLASSVPCQEIERIIKNIEHQRMATIINCISNYNAVCSIFSLPFAFDRLEDIGNIFPDTVFQYVTHLLVHDIVPFNHEFFIRVARSFPLLSHSRLMNSRPQSSGNTSTPSSDNSTPYSIAKYPHLTSLDVRFGNSHYVEQFLSGRKAYVPCLAELTVIYNELRIVSNNFTREETRGNCAKVKRLFIMGSWVHPKEFYFYFPLL